MAKKKKQVEVVFVETFRGGKYLFRTDKPYEKEMHSVFTSLIEQCGLGSICSVSKRLMNEDAYDQSSHVKIMNGMIEPQDCMLSEE